MTDAQTSMESWMRALRMSLTDVSLALHGNAVPGAVPPEALAKLRCTLFAANNALDELVDQLKGPGTGLQVGGHGERRQTECRQRAAGYADTGSRG
jgi:hypothetical protein